MSIIPNDYQKGMNMASEIYDKTIDELKTEKKELKEQLPLHDVSQQRELLMAFMKWIEDNNHTCIKREHWVNDYLEAINCG